MSVNEESQVQVVRGKRSLEPTSFPSKKREKVHLSTFCDSSLIYNILLLFSLSLPRPPLLYSPNHLTQIHFTLPFTPFINTLARPDFLIATAAEFPSR